MRSKGFKVNNIDCTIILEKPKLREFVTEMSQNIARICGTNEENINIKATTEEGLGFTGRKEGVAVHAVTILKR